MELHLKVLQLCKKVPASKEWSAFLFYKVHEGSIKEPDKMVIELTDLHLRDIGTAGATGFEITADDMQMYKDRPERMKWRSGMIHSHHTMDCFFSSTDMDEIWDNSQGVDYYLSVIVNNHDEIGDKKWIGKIAMRGHREVTEKRTLLGKLKELLGSEEKTEEDVLFTYNLNLEFSDAINVVNESLQEQLKTTVAYSYGNDYNYYDPKQDDFNSYLGAELEIVEEDIYACIFMGRADIEDDLDTCISSMSKAILPGYFRNFANQKVDRIKDVIEKVLNDEVTPLFVQQTVDDFITLLRSKIVHNISAQHPDNLKNGIINATIRAFEEHFYGQKALDL